MGQPHSSVFPETVLHGALRVLASGVPARPAAHVSISPVVGVIAAIFVPACAAIATIVCNRYRVECHHADALAMACYHELAADVAASAAALRAQMAILVEHGRAVERLVRGVG